MIIVGYHAIGKSSISGCHTHSEKLGLARFIDLESDSFWVHRIGGDHRDMRTILSRDGNWYLVYCNIAKRLSEQGFHVFMSSHKLVRETLRTGEFDGIPKAIVYPSIDLKDQWIERLQERYDLSKSENDFKALTEAKDMYEEKIQDLSSEKLFIRKEIVTMDYDLRDIVVDLLTGLPVYVEELGEV